MNGSRACVPVVVLLFALASVCAGCNGGSAGETPVNNDRALAVAVQSDGRIVAAGDSYAGASYDFNFALARCNADGSPDAAFGAGGKVTTNIGNDERISDLAVQGDGRIVAAGYSYDGFENFALVRYNANGSLDSTFGYGGKVATPMGGGAQAVVIQGDGKIVAAGYADNGLVHVLALARYRSDGSLDNTFGSGGKVVTAGADGGASDVALQADGKIVVVGGSCLLRYDSGGAPDGTFGAGGKVTAESANDTLSAVAVLSDGRILAAGSSYNGASGYDLAVRRYSADGGLDNTFGAAGKATATVGSLYRLGASVVLNPGDDRIVVAGYSDTDFVLARFNADGSPDSAFGAGGKVTVSVSSTDVLAFKMVVQADGKIVVAGTSYTYKAASGHDFVVMRYNSDGSPDTAFGSDGKAITAY